MRNLRSFGEGEVRDRSPLYAHLAVRAAEDDFALALLGAAPVAQRRANLLFAAVHFLLLGGHRGPLAAYYPSVGGRRAVDAGAWPAFRSFCAEHESELRALLGARRTQTNEVGRSALLAAALAELRPALLDRPVALVDLGTSAGLNLRLDRYGYSYGDTLRVAPASPGEPTLACRLRGEGRPPVGLPRIAARVGLDEAPVDLADPAERRWLSACVWPEQGDRARLLERAMDRALADRPLVVRGDLVDDFERAVDALPAAVPLCVMHSATLTYLAPPRRDLLGEVLGRHAKTRGAFWISLEGREASPARSRLPARDAELDSAMTGVLALGRFGDGWVHDALAWASMHGDWMEWLS